MKIKDILKLSKACKLFLTPDFRKVIKDQL